ncbi:MAG: Uma2 family endonuclease [Candidatus Binatia bacterium]
MSQTSHTLIEELARVPEHGKAEIVNGELVLTPPTGFLPSRAASAVYRSLFDYERRTKAGFAVGDNTGFLVNLPHRQSFSPDAAFYIGTPTGMKFLTGAPVFAVEVRSENDYGVQAEREIAEKRGDYFAAGTIVVWDIDLLSDEVVKVYRTSAPDTPRVYRRGDIAEAEPAVPGWRMPVDELFV